MINKQCDTKDGGYLILISSDSFFNCYDKISDRVYVHRAVYKWPNYLELM